MWQIQAQLVYEDDGGWTGSTGVPTFYLDEDILGIVNGDHACRLGAKVCDPLGHHMVYATAVKLDGKYPDPATYAALTINPSRE